MAKDKSVKPIMTFQAALADAGEKPHLLLGNGFSIALKPDIFSYSSLFDECIKQKCISPQAMKVFKKFNTKDFEIVIRSLNDASRVLSAYKKDRSLNGQLIRDAKAIKETLVKLLSSKHPENPSQITEQQYLGCIKFLTTFGIIYTLNYHLLLYWVIMKALEADPHRYDDGFRNEEGEDYVVWYPERSERQNVYYLHGALHLFDAGAEIRKFTWNRTGINLMKQIKGQLEQNSFPLFVAEGTSKEKMTRVNHSAYLGRGVRSFAKIGGSLFVYGHSLAENDSHYLSLLAKNKVEKLFISIFDDGSSKQKNTNDTIRQRAEAIATARAQLKEGYPIEVYYYDATSAKVWG